MTDPLIRPATTADAAAIAAIYAPIVADTAISFEEEVPDAAEMARRIESLTADGFPYLAAERDGTVLGYAYGSLHRSRAAYRWSADVSVYVDAATRGEGIGRALFGALLPALKAAGYHAAFAGITLPNRSSIGLHEAMGFTKVGVYREVGYKLGAWHDVGWWQRLL